MLTKQALAGLLKLKGLVRGVVFQTDAQYVIEKAGETGLVKLEQRVKELGLPINYRRVKAMEWYPIGLRSASLLVIKETFGWEDMGIRKMGETAPKLSFIVKLFFKLFLSPKKLTLEVSKYWREHHSLGTLKAVMLDEANKELTLRLMDYKIHPLFCLYLEGYFETIMALTRRSRQAAVKEVKCLFRDNIPYHEYKVTWL